MEATKACVVSNNRMGKEVISAQQAEDLKMKEKRKREREKNLPRKKRRRLEAAQEMEDEGDDVEQGGHRGKKEKEGKLLVDVAYRKAKAVKAMKKAQDAGKLLKKPGKTSKRPNRTQSRPEEMRDLFQSEMSERKQRKSAAVPGKKKSFKSKSRYKRK